MTNPLSPLPFIPEPVTQLQARFPRALLKRWDFRTTPPGAANLPPFDRPYLHRAHVFDILGGIRLVIARVYFAPTFDPNPCDWVHVTFSCPPLMHPENLPRLSQIHIESISRGQLLRPTALDGPAELYFLPPSLAPGCLLDDFPGERIRVCLGARR